MTTDNTTPSPVPASLTDAEVTAIHRLPYVRSCLLEYYRTPIDLTADAVVRAIADQIAALSKGAAPAPAGDEASDTLPLDYLQGHQDGLEWAAQMVEANHPLTSDWLYDDRNDLANAIRKGPEMPPAPAQPVEAIDWKAAWERAEDVLTEIRTALNASGVWHLGMDTVDVIKSLIAIPWRATATRSDNWRKYAKEGETAQDVIERERADSAALCKLLEEARASQAEPVAWLRDQRDNYEGRETLDPILILGRTNPGKGINGATYSPVVLAASQAERPAGFVLVPVEPTPEMCKAGEVCWGDPDSGPWATYERMLAAAAPSGGQQK